MMRPLPIRRPGTLLLAVLISLFVGAPIVDAHAELETPTPADGAKLIGSPLEISGRYSEPMTADGSSLKLLDAAGAVLATGGVDPQDTGLMTIDPVPTLAVGTYTIKSTTVSAADGDIDRKAWTFTVVAEAPSATPAPTPVCTDDGSPVPSASPSASPSPVASASAAPSAAPVASADTSGNASGGSDALLPILAALVIVAVIGGILYTRRDRSSPTPP